MAPNKTGSDPPRSPGCCHRCCGGGEARGPDSDGVDRSTRPHYAWIVVMFFNYYSIYMIGTVAMPQYTTDFFGKKAFLFMGLGECVRCLLAFFCAPAVGALSDRFGRRPLAAVTFVAATLGHCTLVFTRNMWVFLATNAVLGPFYCPTAITLAYIADCVAPEERAAAFGRAYAMIGITALVSTATAGIMAAKFGSESVFMLICAVEVATVVFILFVMPESLPACERAELRVAKRAMREEQAGSGKSAGGLLKVTWQAVANKHFRLLLIVLFLTQLGLQGMLPMLNIYAELRWKLTSIDLMELGLTVGVSLILAFALVAPLFSKLLREQRIIQLSCVFTMVYLTAAGLSNNRLEYMFSFCVTIFAFPGFVAIVAAASNAVAPSQQGAVQGVTSAVSEVTKGVGPFVIGSLITATVDGPVPGLALLVCAGLALLAFFASLFIPKELDIDLGDKRVASLAARRSIKIQNAGETSALLA